MPNLITSTESVTPTQVKIPGTSVSVPGASPKVAAIRKVVDQVLQAKAVDRSAGVATPEAVASARATLNQLDQTLDKGLMQAGKDGRLTKKRFAPADRLADANEDLALTLAAVAEAQATSSFEVDDLEEALRDLRKHVTQLARQVARSSAAASESVSWLCAAATIETNES